MAKALKLPALNDVIAGYETNEKVSEHARHNHNYWRWIQGGLALVRKSPFAFDPIKDYWHCTERRLLTAFFASRFRESYAPADAMRKLAFRTFQHFQRAREDGRFGEPRLATVPAGLWPDFCDVASEVAEGLPTIDEYNALRQVWGRTLRGASLKAELLEYLSAAKSAENLGQLEPAFFIRLAWFPYMGLGDLAGLADRQRFYYGYYQLLTSTNSYQLGGGMSFAPVIQNNTTTDLLGYVERWAQGETPHETGFTVEGKSEKRDRSHHAPVVELYGFLNLHRVPFNNGVTAATYALSAEPTDTSIYDRFDRIGERTRKFLESNSGHTERLATIFRALAEHPDKLPLLTVEGIRLSSVAEKYPKERDALIENQLVREMCEAAVVSAKGLGDLDAACAMLHLMLDASIYAKQDPGNDRRPVEPYGQLTLPAALQPIANDALGYLRAGYHVLFAGPPGTGKTTVAQLVGHAWNQKLDEVLELIDLEDAPVTTVGNSAWAPFHTIGGIIPDKQGHYTCVPGIFVDPECAGKEEWQLRGECIVLDEMNRADLDRCIGELYPLLSRSVARVHPAGIPGVKTICGNGRFRVVATVNDATLDDVVFPISEGLARRFMRLELRGATRDDLKGFLSVGSSHSEARRDVALAVVDALFEVCRSEKRVTQSEAGDHLPFGVGYFATLRAWVEGALSLSAAFAERDDKEQARILLQTSLASAVRVRGLDALIEKLDAVEEEV